MPTMIANNNRSKWKQVSQLLTWRLTQLTIEKQKFIVSLISTMYEDDNCTLHLSFSKHLTSQLWPSALRCIPFFSSTQAQTTEFELRI